MELNSLTRAVLRYQRTGGDRETIVSRVGLEVFAYPRSRLGWDEDDCSEFFCYFYPRVQALIERFEYRGKPFEAFLCSTLKWQAKTFASRRAVSALKARAIEDNGFEPSVATYTEPDEADEPAVEEAPPEYSPAVRQMLRISADGHIHDDVCRRRVLFLAMKVAFHLDDHTLDRVARLTGYDRNWLSSCAEELMVRMRARKERLSYLRAKRNHAYFRVYYLHERLGLENGAEEHARLCRYLLQEKRRLGRVIDEMNRVPLTPAHHDIAEVLGVPKGSVDSSLYYLRNQMRRHGIVGAQATTN